MTLPTNINPTKLEAIQQQQMNAWHAQPRVSQPQQTKPESNQPHATEAVDTVSFGRTAERITAARPDSSLHQMNRLVAHCTNLANQYRVFFGRLMTKTNELDQNLVKPKFEDQHAGFLSIIA